MLPCHRTCLAVALAAVLNPAFAAENAADDNVEVIVVTASGFEQRLVDAPASISVMTSEELQQKSFTNLAEALSAIPGVDIRNGVGKTGGLSIQMRGMPADYTLVLIDGRRQNTSGDVGPNGFGEFSTSFMPPLSAIERIEVIRGPMSTLYGSDAMGGVINIITKAVASEWGGNITADHLMQEDSAASNASTFNINIGGPITENLGLQLKGRFFDRGSSERLNPNSTGRDPRPAEGNNYSFGSKLTYKINDEHRVWVEGDTSRQKYDNSDNRLGNQDTYRPDGSPNRISGYEDELRFYREQLIAGHKAAFSFGTWDNNLSHVFTKQEGRTLPTGSAPDFGYDAIGGEARKLENTDLVFDTRLVAPIGDHLVSVGFEYKNSEVIDGAAGFGNAFKQNSRSVYAEDEWSVLDDVRLTVGGRYEDHSAFGGHFTPRAYLVWNTTAEWTIKGGVSTGYKVPTPNQLHDGVTGFGSQGATVTLGTPDLKPEETINYELGVNYNNGALSVTATAFLNDFKNKFASGESIPNCLYSDNNTPLNRPGCITVGNFSQQSDFGQQVNLDEARTKGLELSSSYQIADAWSAKASYTWMETEIKEGTGAGGYLVNNPKHAINATLTWKATDNFSSWLETEFKSDRKRYETAPTTGQALEIYNATGNQLKGYTIFNLGGRYNFSTALRLNVVLYNLLDKDFGETRAYEWNGNTEYAYMYSNTGRSTEGTYIDGRRLWVSLSYDF